MMIDVRLLASPTDRRRPTAGLLDVGFERYEWEEEDTIKKSQRIINLYIIIQIW